MDLPADELLHCWQWATIASDLERMMETAQNNPEMPEDVSAFVDGWKEISRTDRSPDLQDFVIGLTLRLNQIRHQPTACETGLPSWFRKQMGSVMDESASSSSLNSSSVDMDHRSGVFIRVYSLQEIDRCVVIANKLGKMMVNAQEIFRMPEDVQPFVTMWKDINETHWSPNICDFLFGLKLRLDQIQLDRDSDSKGEEPASPQKANTGWLREKFGKLKAYFCCCCCCCCKTSAD